MLKVIGNLKTSTFTEASIAWNHFKTLYGTPGLAGVYINFQKIIHWKMNDKASPSKQIAELRVLLDRLSKNNWEWPQKFQAMLIMNGLPQSYDQFASTLMQSESKSFDGFTVDSLVPKLENEFRCRTLHKSVHAHITRRSLHSPT